MPSGKWRGPRTPLDPIYATPQHKANRAYWKSQDAPCALCGLPIDYTANARYEPYGYHLDHIVPVSVARERGWTTAMINRLSNTRATHRKCNGKAGARLGQSRRGTKQRVRKLIKGTTRVW